MAAPRRENHPGRTPKIDDVRAAYFSGKISTEEANDLANSKDRFVSGTKTFTGQEHPLSLNVKSPSDRALDRDARRAHKRAGLND